MGKLTKVIIHNIKKLAQIQPVCNFWPSTKPTPEFSFSDNILSHKTQVLNIIKLLHKQHQYKTFLTPSMQVFDMLGYIPRSAQRIFACSAILYWYIKKINPNINIKIWPDGSLSGFIPSSNINNKKHIVLQAHMDIVNQNSSQEESSLFGPYGSHPKPKYILSQDCSSLWLDKNNDKMVLGGDDGKGITTIIDVIKYITTNQPTNFANITFILTAIEECPFGYSMKKLCENKDFINTIFPSNFNTILYVNLDTYQSEINTYNFSNFLYQPAEPKPQVAEYLEKLLIQEHELYLSSILHKPSTQANAWTNPPSEVLILHNHLTTVSSPVLNSILFISMGNEVKHPHSNQETIDLIELHKFNNWFISLLNKIS